jgi:hypothetical protein
LSSIHLTERDYILLDLPRHSEYISEWVEQRFAIRLPGSITTCSNLEYEFRKNLAYAGRWDAYEYHHFNTAYILEARKTNSFMFQVPLEHAVEFDKIEQFMDVLAEGTLTVHYEGGMVYGFSDENDAIFFKLTYL